MQMGISSREEFEEWLEDKPDEWGPVLALRSALRVLPLALDPEAWGKTPPKLELIQNAFRILVLARGSAFLGGIVPAAARAAQEGISMALGHRDPEKSVGSPLIAFGAVRSAGMAAGFAGGIGRDGVNWSSGAVEAAVKAAAEVGEYFNVWEALEEDCRLLEKAGPDGLLANFLITEGDLEIDAPQWWSGPWERSRRWLSGSGQGFEIWREWYFGLVKGLPHAFADFDRKADQSFYRWIIDQDDKWWDREPALINDNIRGAVDSLRSHSLSASREPEDNRAPVDERSEPLQEKEQPFGSAPPSEPRKKIVATMRSHEDAPAVKDQLGRQPFAKVLASRLSEHRLDKEGKRKPHEGSFFLHIDGEWGSGKSSVLNMIHAELNPRFKRKLELTDFLEEERANPTLSSQQMWWKEKDLHRNSKPSPEDPWIVVDFNAWREQRNKPAWWALMTQLYLTGRRAVSWPRKIALFTLWNLWRLRYNIAPLLVLGGIIIFSLSYLISPDLSFFGRNLSNDFKALGQILGVLTVIGGVWQQLLIGSGQRSQKIEELRSDPYGPVMRLFDRMIKIIDRPVLVMIDDLDRCEEGYVVSLLESIQTMLRDAPISYLIAGDKRWIISSFEARYLTFSDSMADPGRGLGHLFVDKLFQLSAPLPRVQTHDLESFWSGLLMEEPKSDAAPEQASKSDAGQSASRRAEARIAEAREHARKELEGIVDQLEIQSKIDAALDAGDAVMERAFLAEAAIQISSPESAKELEHRYRPYVVLTQPNPRALKKLVNFLALEQAMVYLEGRKVQPDLLARWCIVQMRWPQLATELASNPHWLDPRVIDKAISDQFDHKQTVPADAFSDGGAGSQRPLPIHWAKLLKDKDLTKVLTHRVVNGDEHIPLDHSSLEQMLQPVEMASERALS